MEVEFEEYQEIKNQLSNFVSDDNLERLEDLLSSYNIFLILGCSTDERTHSKFLAWLFDPNGSHGLGDWFLKRFLRNTLKSIDNTDTVKFVDIETMATEDAEVETEDTSMDITIKIESKHCRFICVIENKISHEEGEEQTNKYYNYVNEHYKNWHHLLLFLTPMGHKEPHSKNFHHITYDGVVNDCLEELMNSNRYRNLSEMPRMMIAHYKKNLEVSIMYTNEEIDRLCQQIYKKHRQAIERIISVRQNETNILRDLITSEIEKNNRLADYRTAKYANIDSSFLVIFKDSWCKPEFQTKWLKYETTPRPFFAFNIEVSKRGKNVKVYLYVDQPREENSELRELLRSKLNEFLKDCEYEFAYASTWRTKEKIVRLPKEWATAVMDDDFDKISNTLNKAIEYAVEYICDVSKVIEKVMPLLIGS
jgi:hypothetical protein